MNETPKGKRGWRILCRILISLAILATLIAIFYTEEDWRGKRAWEQCQRELEAKGEVLDWDKYIPPPVPDDQNFFKAPKMAEWFVSRGETDLSRRLQNPKTAWFGEKDKITTEADARDYLAWSDQFEPDFDLIRQALKHPYARIDGDYSQPYSIPIPNFLTVRILAQTLAQRAHCYFLLGEPQKALEELTFLNDSRRLLEGAPMGKPMTLVAAMINIAVTGLYADVIAEGFQRQTWQESQLAKLQEQLAEINLVPAVAQAFECGSAAECRNLETISVRKIMFMPYTPDSGRSTWQKVKDLRYHLYDLIPRGWVYRNMVVYTQILENMLDSYDLADDLILPSEADKSADKTRALKKWSPYTFLAVVAQPNFVRATQTLAYNQTLVNEAQIACALERYHLLHGEYPETLDALVPQFIEKLPHDIIGGQPLHYHRTSDGKFVLYSVGWNETDDGGQPSPAGQNGGIDFTRGDWVWKN